MPTYGDNSIPPGLGTTIRQPVDPTQADPLVVERLLAGGAAEIIPWLGQEIEVTWPLDDLPTATLAVKLDDGWGVNQGASDAPDIVPLEDALTDGEEVVIRTARGSSEADFELFRGLLAAPHYRAAAGARQERSGALLLEHRAAVLDTEHLVYGQLRLGRAEHAAVINGDSPGSSSKVALCTAYDCVFNPDGSANGLIKSVPLTVGSAWEGQLPNPYPLPVFTHTRDEKRQAWNWARVLLYLLALPRLAGSSAPGGVPDVVPSALALGPCSRFDLALAPVYEAPEGDLTLPQLIVSRNYHTENADTVGPQTDPWARILLAKPDSHSVQSMTWLAALKYTCARCGLHWLIEPVPQADGAVQWGLGFRVREQTRPTFVFLPSRYYVAGNDGTPGPFASDTWETVLTKYNVNRLDLSADRRGLVNRVTALGAAARREVTVELVPGWKANSDWDVDPDNSVAVGLALGNLGAAGVVNDWYNHYVRSGPGHQAGNPQMPVNRLVGRYWIANTVGAFKKTDYGRTWRPWFDFRYDPLDLKDLRLFDVGNMHALAPRPPRPCLSSLDGHTPIFPYVELSFDGGVTWVPAQADAKISTVDLRVFLEADDLRSEIDKTSQLSIPAAYIQGRFRVRLTCGLDLDDATLVTDGELAGHTLSARIRRAVLTRRHDWRNDRRDDALGVTFGNSVWNRTLYPSGPVLAARERQDATVALADVRRFLGEADRVQWRGPITLLGLVFPQQGVGDAGPLPLNARTYRPGDSLIACLADGDNQPSAVRKPWEIRCVTAQNEVGAMIASVTWTYRLRPAALETTLKLEDVNRVAHMKL